MATRLHIRRAVAVAVLACLGLTPHDVLAHGGVVEEEDLCVIKINYFKGHFKIYQPRTDGHEEYCEDLPAATESVFVMEYLHDGLSEVPIDFRIIRDVTGKGRFARWKDVAAIHDLDGATVFYQEPVIEPDVFTVVYDFEAEGDYIGIVTADTGGSDRVYRAVFPFEVGYTGLGYWPLILGILVLVQIQYFVMSGRMKEWHKRRKKPELSVVSAFVLAMLAMDAGADSWQSQRRLFEVQYQSSLDPIPINRIHAWTLSVHTVDGDAVTGAEIKIDGGMPAHDHGLPTRPRVAEELGDGQYRVEGLRFHMSGQWEVSMTITAGGRTDTVTILLEL